MPSQEDSSLAASLTALHTDPERLVPPSSANGFAFDNTYVRLPSRFYARVNPTPVRQPRRVKLNAELAVQLGLDPDLLRSPLGAAILSGNRLVEGAEPLAMAYAGHQFGHFVPQLGDGRANLLGEVLARDGRRYDIQLKGSGPTPFSRRGDGRAALGPVLREYLLSEAMAALGIPSTRALAAVTTGEVVFRETEQPGAVFTRVAASHLRVGTFQYFAARKDIEGLQTLAGYAMQRHDPAAAGAAHPFQAFLKGVAERQARLVSQWMLVGFVHGVMNTDNTAISGETIDYGPCAFMEAYDPATVFSSIDAQGRYAYSNQPTIALWNVTRLAESLLPLLEAESGSESAALASAEEALSSFAPTFYAAHLAGLRQKLGLRSEREGDLALAEDLLRRMAENHADFNLTFRRLSDAVAGTDADGGVRSLFAKPLEYDDWAVTWRERLALETVSAAERSESMKRVNPAFLPRNHRVAAALDAAVERGDFQPFEQLLDIVTHPYSELPELAEFRRAAEPDEQVRWTFCGT